LEIGPPLFGEGGPAPAATGTDNGITLCRVEKKPKGASGKVAVATQSLRNGLAGSSMP